MYCTYAIRNKYREAGVGEIAGRVFGHLVFDFTDRHLRITLGGNVLLYNVELFSQQSHLWGFLFIRIIVFTS